MVHAPFCMRYEDNDVSEETILTRLRLYGRAMKNQSTSTSVRSDAIAHDRVRISTARNVQFVGPARR